MEIKDQYIRQYWDRIVAAQVADELRLKGYKIEANVVFEDYIEADLIATNKDNPQDKTILEIKSSGRSRDAMMAKRQWAIDNGFKFKLIIANYEPLKNHIEFDDFETLFVKYLNDEHPSEFDEFASFSCAEDVFDVIYDKVIIDREELTIGGKCNIELNTWMDNEGDTEFTYYIPCHFEFIMKYVKSEWRIKDVERLDIDTSQLNS